MVSICMENSLLALDVLTISGDPLGTYPCGVSTTGLSVWHDVQQSLPVAHKLKALVCGSGRVNLIRPILETCWDGQVMLPIHAVVVKEEVVFLRKEGFLAGDLRKAGFTANELKRAGYPLRELKDVGFTDDVWIFKMKFDDNLPFTP